jgi:flagellin
MRINTNLGALSAANSLTRVNDAVRSNTEKLSSGFRINRAADDAAGLGVANYFRSDIRALTQAQRNAEQANSVYQIAEGGVAGIQKLLERMKELAAQAASDSVDTAGRARIQVEYTSLINEIDRVVSTTEFQGSKLLDGGYGSTVTHGIGSNGTVTSTAAAGTVTMAIVDATHIAATNGTITQSVAWAQGTASTLNFSALGVSVAVNTAATSVNFSGTTVTTAAGSGNFLIGAARATGNNYVQTTSNVLQISAIDIDATTLGVNAAANASVSGLAQAQTALSSVDSALSLVATALGQIGAGQNRLTNAIESVKSTILNYAAAESAIRDLDMAAEMVAFSKNQIIQQAGVAMLAQANQAGQGVLKLLQ